MQYLLARKRSAKARMQLDFALLSSAFRAKLALQ
jgi:hypothetical protein